MLISMQSTQREYYKVNSVHTHTHTRAYARTHIRGRSRDDQRTWDLAKMIGIVRCAFILHHHLQNTRNKLPQVMAQKVAHSSQAVHRLKVCICRPVTWNPTIHAMFSIFGTPSTVLRFGNAFGFHANCTLKCCLQSSLACLT